MTVRRYLLPEMAEDDLRVLADAEITAYVKPMRGGFQLLVPEALRQQALEILPPVQPDTDPDDDIERCPNCESRLHALGDVDGLLFLVAVVAGVWIAIEGHPVQGVLVFAAAATIIRMVGRQRAAWRCGNCRARFTERELEAARASRRHSMD